MHLKALNANEFKALIREAFEEALEDFFGAPDEGKELKTEVKEQLVEIVKKRQAGARGIPAEEVDKKLGINPQYLLRNPTSLRSRVSCSRTS